MPERKECPLCGEYMRLKQHDRVVRIPGDPKTSTHITHEWVCPECDYFEEAEKEGT